MTRLKKIVLGTVTAVLAIPLSAALFLRLKPPSVSPLWPERVTVTPERLARGRYLAENVSMCAACHSVRDWSVYAGPIVQGTYGTGGEHFGHAQGFPGEVTTSNLSAHPVYGLGRWTDGEIIRAVREGVDREGRPLAPVMPYHLYREMGDDDVRAIVTWVRSIQASARHYPAPTVDFPLSLIFRTLPHPAGPNGNGHVSTPAPAITADYGRYLTTIAGCPGCHTPLVRGQPDASRPLAGGHRFPISPTVVSVSANLTPDPTGLGTMSEEDFVLRFKAHRTAAGFEVPRHPPAAVLPGNTVMPWKSYAGMSNSDLRAIYLYLRTLRPIHNPVHTHG